MNATQWYAQNGKFEKHEQWLVDNLILETIVGSQAFGCQTDKSDFDVIGIVLPKYEHLYPQKYGFILGYDQLPEFKRKDLKGEKNKVLIGTKAYEAEWVSLVNFFYEAGFKGSPNLIESLFVRKELVTVGTKMGHYLRDQRKLFLSMKTYMAFKGFANGQMHRIRQRKPETDDRKKLIEKHGFDTKMAYHTLRLADEIEQVLTIGDIDLMRNKEECKLMRAGEWGTFDRFDKEFQKRMDHLEELARKCNLPPQPQAGSLKKLLAEILEEHFPSDERSQVIDEYISVKEVNEKYNTIIKLLTDKV
jgi:hypothetical protein